LEARVQEAEARADKAEDKVSICSKIEVSKKDIKGRT